MSLPLARYTTSLPAPTHRGRYLLGACLLSAIFVYALCSRASISRPNLPAVLANVTHQAVSEELCPQASPLYPQQNRDIFQRLAVTIGSEGFRSRLVDWVSLYATPSAETHTDHDT